MKLDYGVVNNTNNQSLCEAMQMLHGSVFSRVRDSFCFFVKDAGGPKLTDSCSISPSLIVSLLRPPTAASTAPSMSQAPRHCEGHPAQASKQQGSSRSPAIIHRLYTSSLLRLLSAGRPIAPVVEMEAAYYCGGGGNDP